MQEAAVSIIDRTFDKLYTTAELLPESKYEPVVCLNNIMCECERSNCIGRTVDTKLYMKRLKRNKRTA